MAAPAEQAPEITAVSLAQARANEQPATTPQQSSFKDSATATIINGDGDGDGESGGGAGDEGENGLSRLEKMKSHFGDRPQCFKNTFQEVSFVFQATVATATTSFLAGVAIIITVPVSRDLGMTQSEIAWISASTSYVTYLAFLLVLFVYLSICLHSTSLGPRYTCATNLYMHAIHYICRRI